MREENKLMQAENCLVFQVTNLSISVIDSIQLGILITLNTKPSQVLAVSVVSPSRLVSKTSFSRSGFLTAAF